MIVHGLRGPPNVMNRIILGAFDEKTFYIICLRRPSPTSLHICPDQVHGLASITAAASRSTAQDSNVHLAIVCYDFTGTLGSTPLFVQIDRPKHLQQRDESAAREIYEYITPRSSSRRIAEWSVRVYAVKSIFTSDPNLLQRRWQTRLAQ
ncbi:unnamed protein product [Albugo candida]|uniref:Uncharacterized protein n=1 Tax=Albugo candida TaxID=65357 RepID=A0A024GMH8_9STRA|nr:unnamed protein product [Albugo candida]|eukprot:CCI47903.1 unnamed protein product [Albugo candida]